MTKFEKTALDLLKLPAIKCLVEESKKGNLKCEEWVNFFRECEIIELENLQMEGRA